MNEKVPRLYETENTDTAEKIIYRRYDFKSGYLSHFYWLIAELDPERNLAFGYASLNDDEMAEWGYIDIKELLENGAELDRAWEPCNYRDAMMRIELEEKEGLRMFDEKYGLRKFGSAKNPTLDEFDR